MDEIIKTSKWALLVLINGPHKTFSFGGDKQEDPRMTAPSSYDVCMGSLSTFST